MSALSREPENLPERIARALYHEEQILKRKAAQAAGAREWCLRHSTSSSLLIRRDSVPTRNRTDSNYPLFGE